MSYCADKSPPPSWAGFNADIFAALPEEVADKMSGGDICLFAYANQVGRIQHAFALQGYKDGHGEMMQVVASADDDKGACSPVTRFSAI